jgi:hypothetical protein
MNTIVAVCGVAERRQDSTPAVPVAIVHQVGNLQPTTGVLLPHQVKVCLLVAPCPLAKKRVFV